MPLFTKKISVLSLTLGCLCGAVSVTYSDKIFLKDGRIIEAQITQEDSQRILIEKGGMELPLLKSSIESIERSSEGENSLLKAETAFRKSNPVKGLQLILEAHHEGVEGEDLNEVLRRFNPAISGSIQAGREDQALQLRIELKNILDADFLTAQTYFYTSQNLYQLGDWDGAIAAIDSIPSAKISEVESIKTWALELMNLMVKRRLDRGELGDALSMIERMKLISGDGDSSQVVIALLTRAAKARESGEYDAAFETITGELSKLSPEIAKDRANITLDHMMEYAAQNKSYRFARIAMEPLKQFLPAEYIQARDELIAMEAKHLIENGTPGKAEELISFEIPATERTEKIQDIYKEAYHQKRLLEIKETEPLELFKHAQWCVENEMYSEAIELFNQTRENPNLRDLSDSALSTARRQEDTYLLEYAQKLYDLGDINEVLKLTNVLLNTEGRGSRLREEAQRLQELAEKSRNREEERRGINAETFYQQAERSYWLQNYTESLNLIRLILNRFADTPAAGRAAELLPDVVRKLELQFIEGQISSFPRLPEGFKLDEIRKDEKLQEEIDRLLEEFRNSLSATS